MAATTYKMNNNGEQIKVHTVIYQFTSNGKLDPHFGEDEMVAALYKGGGAPRTCRAAAAVKRT
jgi:hypothetical protein